MPKGVYKRTPAQRRATAMRAAKTRAANRAAQEGELKETRLATAGRTARKTKRFLSDTEKGQLVTYFFAKPGHVYGSWDAVAKVVAQDTGVQLSPQQARRLREAFSLPFDVAGATDGESACEERLRRIESMLAHIQQQVDSWTEEA